MSFQVLSRKGKKDSVLCCVVAGIRIRVLMSAKMHYFLPNLKCLAFTLSFLAISQHRPFSSTICFTLSDLHVGMCRTFICKNTSFLMELGVGCWSRDEAWETWKPHGKKGKKKKTNKTHRPQIYFYSFLESFCVRGDSDVTHSANLQRFCQLWFLKILKEVLTELDTDNGFHP